MSLNSEIVKRCRLNYDVEWKETLEEWANSSRHFYCLIWLTVKARLLVGGKQTIESFGFAFNFQFQHRANHSRFDEEKFKADSDQSTSNGMLLMCFFSSNQPRKSCSTDQRWEFDANDTIKWRFARKFRTFDPSKSTEINEASPFFPYSSFTFNVNQWKSLRSVWERKMIEANEFPWGGDYFVVKGSTFLSLLLVQFFIFLISSFSIRQRSSISNSTDCRTSKRGDRCVHVKCE